METVREILTVTLLNNINNAVIDDNNSNNNNNIDINVDINNNNHNNSYDDDENIDYGWSQLRGYQDIIASSSFICENGVRHCFCCGCKCS